MRGEPGGIQITTILLLLVILAAGYFAYALLPAYSENYTLKQDLSGIVNQAWRREGKDTLQKRVIQKASEIGSHIELPPGGLPVEVRGLPIGEDEVIVTCTDRSQDCSTDEGEVVIAVTYTRVMPLPYLKGKYVTLHFSPVAKDNLQSVAW